jgi:putative transposase
METRHSGHAVYRTEYHIVWIPKYRRRILNPGVRAYLEKMVPLVMESMPGCEVLKWNTQVEHIHVIMIIPPKYAVSDVVGRMKGMIASRLRKKFAWLGKVYWKENVVWSTGYFVSTIGIDEHRVMEYVQWQERQDSGQAKLDL